MILLLSALALAEPASDLQGTWEFTMWTNTSARVPVIGEVQSSSVSQMLMEVDGQGIARSTTCSVRILGGTDMARTVIPAAFVRALPQTEVQLERHEGRVLADLGPSTVGYDPRLGAFPTDLTATSVIDWDGDGMPGATVRLEIPVFQDVDIYLAQRSHAWMEGSVADGRVTGSVDVREFEQVVLEASHSLFDSAPDVKPTTGRFEMAPTAATSCAELMATP